MYKSFVLVLIFLFVSGCASMEVRDADTVYLPPKEEASVPSDVKGGIYHKVRKGETIWRIAKTYGVEVDEIIRQNNIPDVAQIEENQLVLIPGAEKAKEVAVVFKETAVETDFIWPIKGKVIRYFGQNSMNKGIDISADNGQSVKASRSGKVVLADHVTGYGLMVIIDHSDGFYTVYGRNAELGVALNDNVRQGDEIAKLGRSNEGSYLHFQVRKNSEARNPLHYLP